MMRAGIDFLKFYQSELDTFHHVSQTEQSMVVHGMGRTERCKIGTSIEFQLLK